MRKDRVENGFEQQTYTIYEAMKYSQYKIGGKKASQQAWSEQRP